MREQVMIMKNASIPHEKMLKLVGKIDSRKMISFSMRKVVFKNQSMIRKVLTNKKSEALRFYLISIFREGIINKG